MKKVVKIFISIIVIIVFLGISLFLFRYLPVRKFIGSYESVDGSNKAFFSLYKWSFGDVSSLKCDLWGCSGFKSGDRYLVGNDTIKLYDEHDVFIYNYRFEEKDGVTYLILLEDGKQETFKKI